MTSSTLDLTGSIGSSYGDLISKTKTNWTIPVQIILGIVMIPVGIVLYMLYIRPYASEIVFDYAYYLEAVPGEAWEIAWLVPICLIFGLSMLISGLFSLRIPNLYIYENGIERIQMGKKKFFRWEDISYVTTLRTKTTHYIYFIPYRRTYQHIFTLYSRDKDYITINSTMQGNVDKDLDKILHEKTLPSLLEEYCHKLAQGETITLYTAAYPSTKVDISPNSFTVGKESARWEHLARTEIREDSPEYLNMVKKDGTSIALYAIGFPNVHIIPALLEYRLVNGKF